MEPVEFGHPMEDLWHFLSNLFSTDGFTGFHRLNQRYPMLQWGMMADVGMALSYWVMATIILFWIRRRHHESLRIVFWLLGTYLYVAGLSRGMNAVIFFWPAYRLIVLFKVLTCLIAVSCTSLLIPMTPRIMRIPSIRAMLDKHMELRRQLARALELVPEKRPIIEQRMDELIQEVKKETE